MADQEIVNDTSLLDSVVAYLETLPKKELKKISKTIVKKGYKKLVSENQSLKVENELLKQPIQIKVRELEQQKALAEQEANDLRKQLQTAKDCVLTEQKVWKNQHEEEIRQLNRLLQKSYQLNDELLNIIQSFENTQQTKINQRTRILQDFRNQVARVQQQYKELDSETTNLDSTTE